MDSRAFFRTGWLYRVLRNPAEMQLQTVREDVPVGTIVRHNQVAMSVYDNELQVVFTRIDNDGGLVVTIRPNEDEPDWSAYFVEHGYG